MRRTEHWRRLGRIDAELDRWENAPFASVGGLDQRPELQAPSTVPDEAKEAYLEGYKEYCRKTWGDDWATCEFGWRPALTIERQESP